MEQIHELYSKLLGTSKEEQDSMNKQIQILQDSTKNLQTTRDNRQETLQKQLESMKEQKEMREMEIANLKSQIHSEVSNKNLTQKQIDERTEEEKQDLDKRAAGRRKKLGKEIDTQTEELKTVKVNNKQTEEVSFKLYKGRRTGLIEKLTDYDEEMNQETEHMNKVGTDAKDIRGELEATTENYNQRMEERKKRREEEERIAARKAKMDKERQQLVNAAEWVQAHWRGLVTRREMEKGRKKKKKKKKK